MDYLLVVKEGGGGERQFPLEGRTRVRVGRYPTNDLRIASAECADHHVEIFRAGDRFDARLLDSRRGMRVNGSAVRSAELAHGDTIEIGDVTIKLVEASRWVESAPMEVTSREELDGKVASVSASPTASPDRKEAEAVVTSSAAEPKSGTPPMQGVGVREQVGEPSHLRQEVGPHGVRRREGRSMERSREMFYKVLSAGIALLILAIGYVVFRDVSRRTSEEEARRGKETSESGQARWAAAETDPAILGAWRNLLSRQGSPAELIPLYEDFRTNYPKSPLSQRAQDCLDLLGSMRDGFDEAVAKAGAEALTVEDAVDILMNAHSFSSALELCRMYEDRNPGEKGKLAVKELRARLEKAMSAYWEEQKILVEQYESAGALLRAREVLEGCVVELRSSSLEETIRTELKRIERLLEDQVSRARRQREEKALSVVAEAEKDVEKHKYAGAVRKYEEVIGQSRDEARIGEWSARLADIRMFGSLHKRLVEMINRGEGGTREIQISSDMSGKITKADDVEYEVKARLDGGEVVMKCSWENIPAVQVYHQFYKQAPFEGEELLWLAVFLWEIGYEEEFHATLIRFCRENAARTKQGSEILSRKTGQPVPQEGFVVFRGRLVTGAERDGIIREEEERRKAEEAVAALEKGEKTATNAEIIWGMVEKYFEDEKFALAKKYMELLAGKFSDTDEGRLATARLGSPLLCVFPIHVNGPSENRLDMHFMGDGYILDDQKSMRKHATNLANHLFRGEPFKEYERYVNTYAVNVESRESGCDIRPGGAEKDTALGGAVEYSIVVVDHGAVAGIFGEMSSRGLPHDRMTVAFVNRGGSGGTGGGGVAAIGPSAMGIMHHEIGHALAGLGDEYSKPIGGEARGFHSESKKHREGWEKIGGHWVRVKDVPAEVLGLNLVKGSNHDEMMEIIPWKRWVEKGEENWGPNGAHEVGLFEGGHYTEHDVWRPQRSCRMRDAGSEFCVVCMEHMVLRIYDYVKPIDEVHPKESELTLSEDKELVLQVIPMQPRTHMLTVEWFVKAAPQEPRKGIDDEYVFKDKKEDLGQGLVGGFRKDKDGRIVHYMLIRPGALPPGKHLISVRVSDETEWVLEDSSGRLTQVHAWRIEVKAGGN